MSALNMSSTSMAVQKLCTSCSFNVPMDKLFPHIEQYHVGFRSSDNLYDITCGDCNFRVCERSGSKIIEHLLLTNHRASDVKLDWSSFIRKEAGRINDMIDIGLEVFQEKTKKPQKDNQRNSKSGTSRDKFPCEGDATSFANSSFPIINVSETSAMDDETDQSYEEDDADPITEYFDSDPRSAHPAEGVKSIQVKEEFAKNERVKLSQKYDCQPDTDVGLISSNKQKVITKSNKRMSPQTEMSHRDKKYLKWDESMLEKPTTQIAEKSPEIKVTFDGSLNLEKPLTIRTEICQCCTKSFRVCRRSEYGKLFLHGLWHTKIKFLRCSNCMHEFKTWRCIQYHQKRKTGCIGKEVNTVTDDKINKLRNQLQACFPGISFEDDISNTSNSVSGRIQRLIATSNNIPSDDEKQDRGQNDCRLCGRTRISHRIPHALTHSELELYRCLQCSFRFSSPENDFRAHKNSPLGQKLGCQKYEIKETPQDMPKIREIISQCFPEWYHDITAKMKKYPTSLKKLQVRFSCRDRFRKSRSEICNYCRKQVRQRPSTDQQLSLFVHGLCHSELSFYRCTACMNEFPRFSALEKHREKNSDCQQSRALNLFSSEKVDSLRRTLKFCFPNEDFELELTNSKHFGPELNPDIITRSKAKIECKPETCTKCGKKVEGSQKLSHVIFHSGLKLYQCRKCLYRLGCRKGFVHHMTSAMGTRNECDGKYTTVETDENRQHIRELLTECFPCENWEQKIAQGMSMNGLKL